MSNTPSVAPPSGPAPMHQPESQQDPAIPTSPESVKANQIAANFVDNALSSNALFARDVATAAVPQGAIIAAAGGTPSQQIKAIDQQRNAELNLAGKSAPQEPRQQEGGRDVTDVLGQQLAQIASRGEAATNRKTEDGKPDPDLVALTEIGKELLTVLPELKAQVPDNAQFTRILPTDKGIAFSYSKEIGSADGQRKLTDRQWISNEINFK